MTFVIVFVIGSAVLHGTMNKLDPPDKDNMGIVFHNIPDIAKTKERLT